MNQRERNDLDRHITGNGGEDSMTGDPAREALAKEKRKHKKWWDAEGWKSGSPTPYHDSQGGWLARAVWGAFACRFCGGTGVDGDVNDRGEPIDVPCGFCAAPPVQPEPVAWMNPRTEFVTTAFAWPHIKTSLHTVPLYATPPKAPVQPEPVAWCWPTDLTEVLPNDGWCVVQESNVDMRDAVPLYATPPKAPVQPEPVAPDGWKFVLVNEGWEPLMSSLERAHRKGYMPDAITDEYEGFDYRDAAPPKAEPLSDEQIIEHADNFGSGVGEWWGFDKVSLLKFALAILKGKPC